MSANRAARPVPDDELDRFLAELDDRIDVPVARPVRVVPVQPVLSPAPHPSMIDIDALLKHCTMRKGKSSGPGGQHRNKVETLVELTHTPTGLRAHAGERRSAAENHKVAVQRLRLTLAVLVRTPVPDGEVISDCWKAHCRPAGRTQAKAAGRIMVNPMKESFPALLAEGLDVLWRHGLDQKLAAVRLGCTPTQLIRLVALCPPAFAWVNAHRTAKGLSNWKP